MVVVAGTCPVAPSWGTTSMGLAWLSHAMALVLENPPHALPGMFGSATPFLAVPFPSLVCLRP